MLVDLETGQKITKQPYPKKMALIKDRIPQEKLDNIYNILNEMIEGTKIQTSSWMPGSDWTDTPFEPIYSLAAMKNEDLAAKLFGLIVWDVFSKHENKWYSGHFELGDKTISGRTYFRSSDH